MRINRLKQRDNVLFKSDLTNTHNALSAIQKQQKWWYGYLLSQNKSQELKDCFGKQPLDDARLLKMFQVLQKIFKRITKTIMRNVNLNESKNTPGLLEVSYKPPTGKTIKSDTLINPIDLLPDFSDKYPFNEAVITILEAIEGPFTPILEKLNKQSG